ncbi:MAG: tetratricopeptide repeat protein, partial [Steroidobacteraceae bacterium]
MNAARRNEPCPCGSGKRYKACCGRLAAAAQQLPADAVAHFNLGNASARLGRLAEARSSYGQALAIHPDFAEAHQNLGKVLLESGQFEAAAVSCRRALELKPDLPEAHEALGIASMKQANALRSIGHLDAAVAA